MPQKQTAIYVRVSREQQDTRSQLSDLKTWAAGRKNVTWYQDKASGKTMNRPAWSKLEAAITAGQVGAVVVWRIDRLGRTARGLTRLFAELAARRVNLISLRDGLDLSTPAGRLMANVLASVAQYETEIRGERVAAGQAAARAAGKRWGGSMPGVRKKVKPEQILAVRNLHREGVGVSAIARAVGLSRPTIYTILDECG